MVPRSGGVLPEGRAGAVSGMRRSLHGEVQDCLKGRSAFANFAGGHAGGPGQWEHEFAHVHLPPRQQAYLAAQAEFVFVHVSLRSRRVSNLPPAALERLAEIRAAHAALAQPAFIGRSIGLDWKPHT